LIERMRRAFRRTCSVWATAWARSGAAQLSKGAHHAVDVAKNKLGEAGESVVHATESLRDTVGRHPVASIGIAAGIGMIVGLILFRPRS
jgi:ElaB/YqjD/DUF883 family membrane-anchored ribosome-binding protein